MTDQQTAQRAAIDDRNAQVQARRTAIQEAVTLLTPVIEAEYQFNRHPRGCSANASARECFDLADSIGEQITEALRNRALEAFGEDA